MAPKLAYRLEHNRLFYDSCRAQATSMIADYGLTPQKRDSAAPGADAESNRYLVDQLTKFFRLADLLYRATRLRKLKESLQAPGENKYRALLIQCMMLMVGHADKILRVMGDDDEDNDNEGEEGTSKASVSVAKWLRGKQALTLFHVVLCEAHADTG
jgi:hypothetical protein